MRTFVHIKVGKLNEYTTTHSTTFPLFLTLVCTLAFLTLLFQSTETVCSVLLNVITSLLREKTRVIRSYMPNSRRVSFLRPLLLDSNLFDLAAYDFLGALARKLIHELVRDCNNTVQTILSNNVRELCRQTLRQISTTTGLKEGVNLPHSIYIIQSLLYITNLLLNICKVLLQCSPFLNELLFDISTLLRLKLFEHWKFYFARRQ
mmetsp:Transcript_18046/g.38957  ORF Transcript_18046/g.38957 Transcript_18046/m.38957 type:complete len:205 (-) Transcript_18046:3885-4499(-)